MKCKRISEALKTTARRSSPFVGSEVQCDEVLVTGCPEGSATAGWKMMERGSTGKPKPALEMPIALLSEKCVRKMILRCRGCLEKNIFCRKANALPSVGAP
jgi:hypothetical protein